MTDLPLQNPVDLNRMRVYRLSRIRAELKRRDISAAILTGPQNLRYATDARNMSVWTLFNWISATAHREQIERSRDQVTATNSGGGGLLSKTALVRVPHVRRDIGERCRVIDEGITAGLDFPCRLHEGAERCAGQYRA